jgi:tetratricopeptide (TPR) repeat protein
MNTAIRLAIAFGCVALLASQTSTVRAEQGSPGDMTTDAARVHFQTGVDYYRDGDFEGARAEFERAYERAPNYKLLYNLGQLSVQLRDYVAAQRYFRQYLEQAGEQIDAERKAEVGLELVKLQRRIGSLTLTSNAAAVPTDPPDGAPEATGSIDAALWWGAGTGALAMGAGVMAYLTSRDVRAYNAELAKPTTEERLDQLSQQAKTKALVTDVLIGATLAAGITTLVIAVTDGDSERAPSAGQQPHAELLVGVASLQLAGKF